MYDESQLPRPNVFVAIMLAVAVIRTITAFC